MYYEQALDERAKQSKTETKKNKRKQGKKSRSGAKTKNWREIEGKTVVQLESERNQRLGACGWNESESGQESTAVKTKAEGNESEKHRKRLELEKEQRKGDLELGKRKRKFLKKGIDKTEKV